MPVSIPYYFSPNSHVNFIKFKIKQMNILLIPLYLALISSNLFLPGKNFSYLGSKLLTLYEIHDLDKNSHSLILLNSTVRLYSLCYIV